MADQEITRLIKLEEKRQAETLMLIPSENYSSRAVREAAGSILVHKYAEGYPGKRYYQGNKIIDEIETLAINRAKKLFGVPHVNVQPYSGSPANMAVYFACCNPGDTVMGMDLTAGGHLTHGWKVNFSGMLYKSIQYTTDKNGWLDYEEIEELAQKYRPKIIWAGATAYPRFFDWEKFGKIADSINALFAADIAHYAGLIVGGVYPSPVPFTHVITTTTHKTLRGPRAALILVTEKGLKKDHDLPQKIDRAVFPGLQGGPHENTIAALAVALAEASRPSFKNYAQQVVENAKILAEELKKQGFNLVTGGTDNHLILSDLSNLRIDGKNAAVLLEKAGLVVNANSIPHDPNPPFRPSGIRLGTPAVTTRGMGKEEMVKIAGWIEEILKLKMKNEKLKTIRQEVRSLCQKFPVPD
jgi:glycine hydroxymethyltransferase